MESIFRAIFQNTFGFILRPLRMLFAFFRRVIPGIKWLSNLKPEILAAVLVFVFLLVIWVCSRFFGGSDEAASPQTQLLRWTVAITIIVAIAVVVYLFLRVLFQPPKSPFPDIYESWNVGVKEMEKNGLPIKDLPIFLVIGMRDSKQIRYFIEASGMRFDIEGVTGSGQSLIWYAAKDRVYLFLANVGNFTEFSAKSQHLPMLHATEEQDFTHTANIKDFYEVPKHQLVNEPEDTESDITSTVRASDIIMSGGEGQASAKAPASESMERVTQPDPLRKSARANISEQRKRLKHLATLIRRTRDPVSPINGILVNANVNVVESYPEELSRQLRDDLNAVCFDLGVVCATILVITGLERDNGFLNFADRLIQQNGPEFSKSKFGKSYRTWTPPSTEQLEQVAQSAVEEFDHFIHLIFTKRDALSAENVQGNRNLVLFLCRLYSSILPGLKIVLGKGCGLPQSLASVDFPRFAGCYFVGNDEHHDYFLNKVFDRLEENQGELEWTHETLRREDNWKLLANIGYLIGLACLIAFVFLLFGPELFASRK